MNLDQTPLKYVLVSHHTLDVSHHILDVFRGQVTSEVTNLLRNNIFFVIVPNNMTHLFQPFDLTVNGYCKSFMKKKFAE